MFNSPRSRIIYGSLIVYLVTAIFSVGYYHFDEHFQILEFCNYKLGESPASDLPWEFHEKIRPALQPMLAFWLIKVLGVFFIKDPFASALVLRLITAMLAWFVTYKISGLLIGTFTTETGKKLFLFMGFLLGYVPFLSVRFSSENLSALSFLGALYFILASGSASPERRAVKLAAAGALLGFSFFFRFQIAFEIVGLFFWLLIIRKSSIKDIQLIAFSMALVIMNCMFLDSYESFQFTPYNYFDANILRDKASGFGTEDGMYYLNSFIFKVVPLFGVILLLLFVCGCISRPKDVFVWCLLPFLMIHFLIPHKELRFLFPLAFGFSYLTAAGLESLIIRLKIPGSGKLIFIPVVLMNVPFLINNMLSPADKPLYFYKLTGDLSSKKEAVLVSREPHAFDLWGLKCNFYKSCRIKCLELPDTKDFLTYLDKNPADTLYVMEKASFIKRKYEHYSIAHVYPAYPDWTSSFNFGNWQTHEGNLQLLQLVRRVED